MCLRHKTPSVELPIWGWGGTTGNQTPLVLCMSQAFITAELALWPLLNFNSILPVIRLIFNILYHL